ncbi:MAG: OmpA family protein, partial [Bacteroidota bacterium]
TFFILTLFSFSFLSIFFNTVNVFSQKFSYKIENLGPNINSECDELMPVISPDGKTLYFCRGECKGNYGGQDIWYSELDSNGNWLPAKNIGPSLNNQHNNFVASVSPDGNTLLLGNVYIKDTLIDRGLSITRRVNGQWSDPEKILIQDYYNLNVQSGFFLSDDLKVLLMTVQRKDSWGKKDIYVSFLYRPGEYSIPMNLGPMINTSGDELAPFLASDGASLYFSSDGLIGNGIADVFLTRRLDSTWLHWSKPENLGLPINTEGWDSYYKFNYKGKYAYYVSTTNAIGQGDIFRIVMNEPTRPKPELLITGKVINYKTRAPISTIVIFKKLPENKIVGSARSSPWGGDYSIVFQAGSKYSYSVNENGFMPAFGHLDLTNLTRAQEIVNDIELIPLEDSLKCIRNIFFDTDKFNLSKEACLELDYVAVLMQDNPDYNLVITGHTDSTGTEEHNRKLGLKRAQEATTYLVLKSIDTSRIKYRGLSWNNPVASNKTQWGKQLNRRVEFIVFKGEEL